MSEAFVNTLRRNDLEGADLTSGAAVSGQLPGWIADSNGVAAYSALGMRSPWQ